jgi:hypothetical protein
MVQVLHMSNGETLNPKLATVGNAISKLIDTNKSNEEIVDQLFLVALSRKPMADEKTKLIAVMEEYGDERRTAIEDAYWSVLTSTEFTFNH